MSLRIKNRLKFSDGLPTEKYNFDLGRTLEKLDKLSVNFEIKKMKIYVNEYIFKKCTIKEFIEGGNRRLRNVQICISEVPKMVEQKEEIQEILERYHNDPMSGGHIGNNRLLKKIRANFKCKNMEKDVRKYVKNCHECRVNKAKPSHKEKFVITDTAIKQSDITYIDTIGPFVESNNGDCYCITILCELTKYAVMIPVKNKEAQTIAKAIFDNFIPAYGLMKEMRTDQGTEYKNEVISRLAELLKMKHNFSTAYHHESIGSCENFIERSTSMQEIL